MTLDLFLKNNNCYVNEGYTSQVPEQVRILKDLINNDKIINILEIGMNAGHSSCLFLENNEKCNVFSFDIGTHHYVNIGKQYIDNTYPNRHKLFIGDSKISLPLFINNYKEAKMDVIFIDGGHDYGTATSDLINCRNLSHKDTILIMDDTITYNDVNTADWNIGPTQAWNTLKSYNLIEEKKSYVFRYGRGMSIGRYLL